MAKKNKGGRPPGKIQDKVIQIRCDQATIDAITRIAAALDLPRSVAVRKALKDTARRLNAALNPPLQ